MAGREGYIYREGLTGVGYYMESIARAQPSKSVLDLHSPLKKKKCAEMGLHDADLCQEDWKFSDQTLQDASMYRSSGLTAAKEDENTGLKRYDSYRSGRSSSHKQETDSELLQGGDAVTVRKKTRAIMYGEGCLSAGKTRDNSDLYEGRDAGWREQRALFDDRLKRSEIAVDTTCDMTDVSADAEGNVGWNGEKGNDKKIRIIPEEVSA